MRGKEIIRRRLSDAQLYGQLAEEAAELAQAALKLQRLSQGVNLPRKDAKTCIDALNEELADVELCLEILQAGDRDRIDSIKEFKTYRWVRMLREEEELYGKDSEG